MPNIAGNLLLNRRHLTLAPGTTDVDTGLQQNLRAFPVGEPTDDPAPGSASRIMVIPMSPIIAWVLVTHGEPYLDSTTKTVHVVFTNSDQSDPIDINVLFWDPHSAICPLDANLYNGGGPSPP